MTGLAGRTLLVTGGGGFLGRAVLADLLETFPGRIISIHRSPLADQGLHLPDPHVEVRADLRDAERWCGLLHEADYVVWLAALRDHGASRAQAERANVEPLRAALAVLRKRRGFTRLVFASSISALDQPNRPGRPRPLTDASPACPRTPYGNSKLVSERLLAASGVPHCVLRLPFLYGPAFRPGSFLDFYRTVARTPALSALRFTGNLSLLYTGDVARLLLAVIDAPGGAAGCAPGGAADGAADASPYLVSDGVTYEVDDLVSLVAREHGLSRPRLRVPLVAGRMASATALVAHRLTRPRPVPRGRVRLLAGYWCHAAFTRDYFVVDASRFHAAFPQCTFTPVRTAIRRCFAVPVSGQPYQPRVPEPRLDGWGHV